MYEFASIFQVLLAIYVNVEFIYLRQRANAQYTQTIMLSSHRDKKHICMYMDK